MTWQFSSSICHDGERHDRSRLAHNRYRDFVRVRLEKTPGETGQKSIVVHGLAGCRGLAFAANIIIGFAYRVRDNQLRFRRGAQEERRNLNWAVVVARLPCLRVRE